MVVSYSKWVLGTELTPSAVSTPNSRAICQSCFFLFFFEIKFSISYKYVHVHVCHGTHVEITTLSTLAWVQGISQAFTLAQ